MTKRLHVQLALATCLFFSFGAQAQSYFYNGNYYEPDFLYEAGLSFNAMNCLTDLGGSKQTKIPVIKNLNLGKTGFSVGAFGSFIYQNTAGVRLEATYGQLSASDSRLKGQTGSAASRFNRNLDFKTNILEIAAIGEIYPLPLVASLLGKENPALLISPYLLAGVGFFHFEPQGSIPGTNTFVNLEPLRTEGQGFAEYPDRERYKLSQMNFPLGFGAKYELNRLLNLRVEALYRVLTTDYLDDVSTTYIDPALFDKYLTPVNASIAKRVSDKQIVPVSGTDVMRGSPTINDSYFTINLKVSFTIGRERR